MSNVFETWFSGEWTKFINWLGSDQAAVVAEGKTIIDELVPVFKQDLLADGGPLLATATAALSTGGIGGILTAAEGLIPALAAQGIAISKEAATTLAAFVSAKISAAQAPVVTPAPAPAP